MKIVRIPKSPQGAVVAKLVISPDHPAGRVTGELTVQSTMQASTSREGYASVSDAEHAAEATARQRGAALLVIEDRT